MTIIWNPRITLELQSDAQQEWRCIGSNSSNDSEDFAPSYGHIAQLSGPDWIRNILFVISRQMPDEVEHEILVDLARVCLCTEHSGGHHGDQNATIIYDWTELLSAQASGKRDDRRPF